MGRYSIKDLEKISGIKAHTIRMWERRYQLIEPQRTDTNIRFYSDCDLKRLLNISILNHHGIKVSHIAGMTEEEIKNRVLDIAIDNRVSNVQIENMMISLLELDENKFANALTAAIIKHGFECTVETVLFPFLERISILWQAGTIAPAQECFMTSLIRQKLCVAIDNEMQNNTRKGPRIVFFLPKHEKHEIELLFYNLIARKEGLEVIYLGASVTADDLRSVHRVRPADIFMMSFVSILSKDEMEKVMEEYHSIFPDSPFLVSGLRVKDLKAELPEKFSFVESVKAFKDYVRLFKYSE